MCIRCLGINWTSKNFLLGAIAPVPVWLAQKAFPNQDWIRLVNMPVLIGAAGLMPAATAINYSAWIMVGFLSGFVVCKYKPDWWQRHNYVLSGALDARLAFMGVLLYLCLGLENIGLNWWGNELDGCPYASCPTAQGIVVDGCPVVIISQQKESCDAFLSLGLHFFFMLLTCNCTVVKILPLSNANANSKPWKLMFGEWILFVNRTRNTFLDWLLGIFRRRECDTFTNSRCAESLSTINLISFCLNRGSKGRRQFHNYFGLANFLNGIWHVKPRLLTHDMTSFIFDELKVKSMVANSLETAERICSSKGEWVLQEIEGHDAFLPFVSNYNYAETVLLWHISTELCCNGSQDQVTYYAQRDIAKNLSDYMLYLLVMKPDMVSSVSSAGNKMFLDTCIEVGKLFDIKLPELKKRMSGFFGRESKKEKEALHIKACETIFCINRDVKPVLLQKEDRYKLLLFDASVLAKELKLLPLEQKWLTISKLWVELLSYAATHIRSSAHVQNLSKGGELITVVWLLMAHFGLGDQFEISCVDI
ncbi:hypothetical protein ACET3Z_006577 [Daucus carota]